MLPHITGTCTLYKGLISIFMQYTCYISSHLWHKDSRSQQKAKMFQTSLLPKLDGNPLCIEVQFHQCAVVVLHWKEIICPIIALSLGAVAVTWDREAEVLHPYKGMVDIDVWLTDSSFFSVFQCAVTSSCHRFPFPSVLLLFCVAQELLKPLHGSLETFPFHSSLFVMSHFCFELNKILTQNPTLKSISITVFTHWLAFNCTKLHKANHLTLKVTLAMLSHQLISSSI